jgi:hypothetical protein
MDVTRMWLGDNRWMLICLLGLTTLLVGAALYVTRQYALPGEYEDAEVLRFGGIGSRVRDHLIVVVRMRNGEIWTLQTNLQDVLYCHAGSRIRLVRHGTLVIVDGPACMRGG